MKSSHLPTFIYQMIDHIYIADHRGVYFAASFPFIIDTTNIKERGTIIKTEKENQLVIQIKKDSLGQIGTQNITVLTNEISKATERRDKILLYSDDYRSSSSLFITYVMIHYHFTKTDIQHMIASKQMNESLVKAMQLELLEN